jgi:hypothetical protein
MTAGSSADSAAGTVPPPLLKTSSAADVHLWDRISRASCRRFVFPCASEDESSPQLQEEERTVRQGG